jgi:hypothetical protein
VSRESLPTIGSTPRTEAKTDFERRSRRWFVSDMVVRMAIGRKDCLDLPCFGHLCVSVR